MPRLYEQAAATCPGLPWTVLAGIGTVESRNGTLQLNDGPVTITDFWPASFASMNSFELPRWCLGFRSVR